ncbi:YkvA family protein [Streptomyces sp. NPDC050803]|uniref:YkvA family protein n=1 Tax=unclassified Streptomyces TaxID=2593676 RepID=UPI0034389509
MDSTTGVIALAAVLAAAVLAVAVLVLVRLVRTRRGLRRAGLPTGPRWVFWGALLYFVLPADLVPDPVYLDDIGVLLLALRTLRRSADVRTSAAAPGPPHLGRRGDAG